MGEGKKILDKSNLILKIIFGLSLFVICTSNRLCPNHKICDCTTKYINCTCNNNNTEDIIVNRAKIPFVGKHFIIKNCSYVEIRSHALSNLTMNNLVLENLIYLKIESYSFNDSEIKHITIEKIKILDIEKHTFSELKNVTNLVIANVKAENFTSGAFADVEVENLEIRNSQIKNIQSNSFVLSKIAFAAFRGTHIENFKSKGLQLNEAKKFYFHGNTVVNTNGDSFVFTDTDEVEFVKSQFTIFNTSMIYIDNVTTFSFHNCLVVRMESKAFWNINATTYVQFTNNTLLSVGEDSLMPNLGPNNLQKIKLEIAHNVVFCHCQLNWIFQNPTLYYQILNTSVCKDIFFENSTLSVLTPFVDEFGLCCGLTITKTVTTESTVKLNFTESIPEFLRSKENNKSNVINFYNGLLLIVAILLII